MTAAHVWSLPSDHAVCLVFGGLAVGPGQCNNPFVHKHFIFSSQIKG